MHLADICEIALVGAGTCEHVGACGFFCWGACVRLHMWVHARFYSGIYKERWALLTTGRATSPYAHVPPLLPSGPTSTVSSPRAPRQWGTPPPDHRRAAVVLKLSHGGANSVCLLLRRYLNHAPTRPHTRPHTHTTPLHATTLHSHLPPDHTPAPLSHFYFGYKLPVWHVPLGLASVVFKDSATLHIHTNHSVKTRKHPTPTPLGKVYIRVWTLDCTLLNQSPKSVRPLGVHGHCIGWCLVGVPLRRTLPLVWVVCLLS